MPENEQVQTQEQTAEQQNQSELAYHVAMAFGEKPPPVADPNQSETDNGNDPAEIPKIEDQQASDVQTFDEPAYLKEVGGWESREAALAELNELRALKANPPQTVQEVKFANDESKKWHQYFVEGKEDDLYTHLHARQMLKNLDTLNEDQQLRLFYKMQNPLYDDELIDLKMKKEYGFNEEEFKDAVGDIVDHAGYRLAKADSAFKKQNDLQKAKDFFGQYKQKVELPDISPKQATVDQDYEDYKASNAKSKEDYETIVAPSINALKPADLQLVAKVDDPKNQMQFEVSIVPEAGDFDVTKRGALDYFGYMRQAFYDDKGNFQAAKLSRAILLEKYFDKYAQSIARQAVNAERKRVVEKESGQTMERNFNINPQQQTALQSEMDRAFAV